MHDIEQIRHHAGVVGDDLEAVADARPVGGFREVDDAVFLVERGDGDVLVAGDDAVAGLVRGCRW